MDALSTKLNELSGDLQAILKQSQENKQAIAAVQRQCDAIDEQRQKSVITGFGGAGGSVARTVWDSAAFKFFAETGKGRVAVSIPDFQTKTTLTGAGVGLGTTGVVGISRVPGIVPAPISTFRLRELLRIVPTTGGIVDFVKLTAYTQASPQTEASDKKQATLTISSESERVQTLAHWIPASKQVLQDVGGLEEAINTHLIAGLFDEEDSQILNGAGTGDNLNGLVTQATSFDTGLLAASDGYEYSDNVAWAIQQAEASKHRITGIVLHPADWWKIILCKDTTGRYIHGDPAALRATMLWGRPVAVTPAQSQGTFLVGDFQSGAALHLRMDATIGVSDSHSDFYIKNMLAILAEERLALTVYKPGAFITGSFQQSPA